MAGAWGLGRGEVAVREASGRPASGEHSLLAFLEGGRFLSDKQVTMNSADGNAVPSLHREYFGLNLCCEQWLSPGLLRSH